MAANDSNAVSSERAAARLLIAKSLESRSWQTAEVGDTRPFLRNTLNNFRLQDPSVRRGQPMGFFPAMVKHGISEVIADELV